MAQKIESNKAVFAKLWSIIPSGDRYSSDYYATKKRFIQTDSIGESRLRKSKLQSFEKLLPNIYGWVISVGDEHFAAYSSDDPLTALGINGVHSDESKCTGLCTMVMANYCELRNGIEYHEIIEELAERENGIDLGDVLPLFSPFGIYQVDKSLVYNEDLSVYSMLRVYLCALLQAKSSTLKLTDDTYILLQNIVESHMGWIYADQIFNVLTSPHYEHAFLDIYRCIERLYTLPYCLDMHQKLMQNSQQSSAPKISDLEKIVSDSLSWRPKEDVAIERLIKNCSPSVVDSLQVHFPNIARSTSRVESVAKQIYTTRNSIAHYRKCGSGSRFNGDWIGLIAALVSALNELFTFYRSHLIA